jgi:hypothetical protein
MRQVDLKGKQKFPRVYNKTDFGLTADVVCQPNIFTPIGQVIVPAGQNITYGIGGVGAGVDTREPAYIRLDATGGQLQGTIRLVLTDPNEINTIVVAEQRTERFSASINDKTQAFLLGEYTRLAGQDSKLIIQFKPDSATAVTIDEDDADTSIIMPATTYQ